MKVVYAGVNGRKVAIDLDKVEAVLEEDGETHLLTSSDHYKVRHPYADVVDDWLGTAS